MARNAGNGTKGISPKDAKVNPVKKKNEQPIMGFEDVAGTPGEPVITEEISTTVTKEVVNEEPTTKVELKQEESTETPTNESKTDEEGNTGEEPVVEENKQEEPTPTVENKQNDEPTTTGENNKEEKKMTKTTKKTKVKDSAMALLEGEKNTVKKITKSYFIEKEVGDKIDELGKKVPKSMGGTGAFVNELLKQALIDRGLWEEKE